MIALQTIRHDLPAVGAGMLSKKNSDMYMTATSVAASERISIHLISHVSFFIHVASERKSLLFFVHFQQQRRHRFECVVSDCYLCFSVRTHLNPSFLTCVVFHSHLPPCATRLFFVHSPHQRSHRFEFDGSDYCLCVSHSTYLIHLIKQVWRFIHAIDPALSRREVIVLFQFSTP